MDNALCCNILIAISIAIILCALYMTMAPVKSHLEDGQIFDPDGNIRSISTGGTLIAPDGTVIPELNTDSIAHDTHWHPDSTDLPSYQNSPVASADDELLVAKLLPLVALNNINTEDAAFSAALYDTARRAPKDPLIARIKTALVASKANALALNNSNQAISKSSSDVIANYKNSLSPAGVTLFNKSLADYSQPPNTALPLSAYLPINEVIKLTSPRWSVTPVTGRNYIITQQQHQKNMPLVHFYQANNYTVFNVRTIDSSGRIVDVTDALLPGNANPRLLPATLYRVNKTSYMLILDDYTNRAYNVNGVALKYTINNIDPSLYFNIQKGYKAT